MEEQHINPFSIESEICAQKLDYVSLSENVVELEKLLSEIEKMLPDEGAASQALLYYSIGTVYGDYAKTKGLSYDESIRKQLYCFRKSVDIIEDEEYAKKRICSVCKGVQA